MSSALDTQNKNQISRNSIPKSLSMQVEVIVGKQQLAEGDCRDKVQYENL
jgi:hypothetical protein